MNVTLSLTSELSDVPKELSYMMKFVQYELDSISKSAENTSSTIRTDTKDKEGAIEHFTSVLDRFHTIRVQLAKLDTRMEDCMSVLGGFIEYIENPPEDDPEGQEEIENEEG